MAQLMTFQAVLADMEPARRERVKSRAAEIAREYHALQELRKARTKTQVEVAKTLGVSQPYIAKLEQRTDLMLSVLQTYVRSLGGELELAVSFPDCGRVVLRGIGDADMDSGTAKGRVRRRRADRHPT